jgi:hypothetical protein
MMPHSREFLNLRPASVESGQPLSQASTDKACHQDNESLADATNDRALSQTPSSVALQAREKALPSATGRRKAFRAPTLRALPVPAHHAHAARRYFGVTSPS